MTKWLWRSEAAEGLASDIWESFMEEVAPLLGSGEHGRLDCVVMGNGRHL